MPPPHQHGKRPRQWTDQESQKELRKYTDPSTTLNEHPDVKHVRSLLNANLAYFINNVGSMVAQYSQQLEDATKAREEGLKQLDAVPRHPVRRTIRVPVVVMDEEEGDAAATSATENGGADAAAAKVATPLQASRKAPGTPATPTAAAGGKKKLTAAGGSAFSLALATAAGVASAKPGGGPKVASKSKNKTSVFGLKSSGAAAPTEEEDDDDDDSVAPEPSADAPPCVFPPNGHLVAQLTKLKAAAYEMSTMFEGISDWIALSIPEVDKGLADGMGLAVMMAVMQAVSGVTETVRSVYTMELSYVQERIQHEIDCIKYRDAAGCLLEFIGFEASQWDEVVTGWRGLLRALTILYNTVRQNLKALKEPLAQSQIALGGSYM